MIGIQFVERETNNGPDKAEILVEGLSHRKTNYPVSTESYQSESSYTIS